MRSVAGSRGRGLRVAGVGAALFPGERPHRIRVIRLVGERVQTAMIAHPALAEVGFDALPVAPRSGVYAFQWEAAFGEKVLHPQFRPPRAIDRAIVNADQERSRNQKVAARVKHLMNMAPGTVRPEKMFKNLLGDDEVER